MEEQQEGQAASPRVSVVIVSYHNAGALRRCLAALESARERESFEIIVVDNGSRDECARVDAEFPGIQMLRLPRNFGVVKALNIGMRTALGEFFLFLEPEMEVAADTVSRLAAQLEASPDAVAVCPLVVNPAGETLSRVHPLPLPPELYQAWRDGDFQGWTPPAGADPLEVDYFKPPAMMVRSYFLRGLRHIDDRYGQAWWELEICTQIRKVSKKILLVGAASVVSHPPDRPPGMPANLRGLLEADRALGAVVWCAKHYGWGQGFKFRLAATFLSLGRLLRLRDAGCQWALFSCLLNGQKLDGSQTAL